jgi:hypothetical protein
MELLIAALVVLAIVLVAYRVFQNKKSNDVDSGLNAPYKIETPTEVAPVPSFMKEKVDSPTVTAVETKVPELKVETGGKQSKPVKSLQRKPRTPKSTQPKAQPKVQASEKKPVQRKPRPKTKPTPTPTTK